MISNCVNANHRTHPVLDHVYNVDGLEWFGNTNELNAAYAADGYARVKNGVGCLVTTHGVGELSALNAIAGSMTEEVKVIHVVGQTSLKMQKNRMMIHHSIGFSPDHQDVQQGIEESSELLPRKFRRQKVLRRR